MNRGDVGLSVQEKLALRKPTGSNKTCAQKAALRILTRAARYDKSIFGFRPRVSDRYAVNKYGSEKLEVGRMYEEQDTIKRTFGELTVLFTMAKAQCIEYR